MNKCHSLPGIVKVGYINCSDIPRDIPYRAVSGVDVTLNQQPTDVRLVGEAVCEVEQQQDNNVQMEKVRLAFTTLDEVPTYLHLAFTIKTADNERYIIGSQEKPYPTVKVTRSTGQTDGDASAAKYEVSYTARKGMAPYE